MPEPIFELVGVTKRFGGPTALGPLDFRAEAGSTTALVGASGAGKSTLLRLLNGLVRPDAGQVRFRGVPLHAQDLAAARRQMGTLVQGGGLFPHLSARDNVALLARCLGWPEPRIAARIEALADLARLPLDALARFPSQLSGGQAQRVSLVRALLLDPDALLLDEPLSQLDPITRYDLQADLRDVFVRLRKTVVLVTHDLAEAAFLADRAVLLDAGAIVQEGRVPELVRAPATPFVARFVRAQRVVP